MNQIILPNIDNRAEQQRLIAAGQGIVRLTRLGSEKTMVSPPPMVVKKGGDMTIKGSNASPPNIICKV